jgi:hypothetical protein
MIHGDVPADAHEGSPPAQDSWTLRLAALILFAALCGLVWWLTTLAPADDFSFM